MNKLIFFLNLYRTQKMRFFLLVFIFAFAGAILSCTLLIYGNNKEYYQAQMKELTENHIMSENAMEEGEYTIYDTMEKILTVFSLCSILIVIWGCTSILFFQNISMQKSHAMLQIFGMQKKDVFCRAWVEGTSFGILGGIIGDAGGYFLFRHLSKKLCNIETQVHLFSMETFKVLLVVIIFLVLISFFGSFISGLVIYEKPIVVLLYGRKAEERKEKVTYRFFIILEFGLLYLLASILFYRNQSYINIILIICGIVLSFLFVVFYLMFKIQTKRRYSEKKKLNKISGISYRFLCTRNKRDALLAATISIGAIIICFVLNIIFNSSEILRDSYRDNMGYSTTVWLDSISGNKKIQDILDKNGYFYTKGYSKRMNYSGLNGISADDFFFTLVLESQTDGNNHFKVLEGSFAAENKFVSLCNLELGTMSDIFGKDLLYAENIKENQWLSLIMYNIKVNKEDWNLGLDDTWSTVFLLDLSESAEKDLISLLKNEACSVETASQLTDMIIELLSEYLSVVAVAGMMLILVTGAFFYSMVRSDLLSRKRELYLYQIYGASRRKAFWVVYLEYLLIAWIASFSVILVVMVLGDAVFSLMLNKHYPLSIPVVLITSFVSTLFVLICCMVAQLMNFMSTKMEIIRDE